jgi:hypothetical protein
MEDRHGRQISISPHSSIADTAESGIAPLANAGTGRSTASREYCQHALLQAFYYSLLGRHERQLMHRRAGEYCEYETREL